MPRAHKAPPLLEPLHIGGHALPSLWRDLLPEDAQWLALPQERLATCDSCYWARLGKCRDECRCCSYFPQLPNFLVGLALKDPSSRAAMLAALEAHPPLPLGMMATPAQFLAAVKMRAEDRFGDDPEQNCPFLRQDAEGCAIHPYRNSVCATFFCEHDHGEQGEAAWRALQALAGHAETVLGQWAMDEVGLSSQGAFAALDRLADDIDELHHANAWSMSAREALWGDWLGRELAFFEACADAVMARREQLYEIACQRRLFEARGYEEALLAWLPGELRDSAPDPSEGEAIPLSDLWYRLQLTMRQLGALPFGEGHVRLAKGLVLDVNAKDDRLSRAHEEPRLLRGPAREPLLFCDQSEAQVLELFNTPRALDEDLFVRPEIEGLDDPRRRLAEWMRRGILVTVDT